MEIIFSWGLTAMDFSLRKCSRYWLGQTTMDFSLRNCSTDRLSSLPDELICQILSLLSTKDAAVASLSSRKMRSAFTLLTTLDFDDSPISYCARNNPQFIDRFQFFKSFVDNVLRTSQSPNLSRYRLKFGGDDMISSLHYFQPLSICGRGCFPDMESSQLNGWIGFPLSRCGIREIDLCIHVRKPGMLPWTLFACQTLEVLKVDTNLDFELVSSMPSFRLPNLKELQLCSIVIPEDDLVNRLVSNYPLLEKLHVDCRWKYGNSVTISSPSLLKLVLHMNKDDEFGNFFRIDTPNLQHLLYNDILAEHYSVASMKALVKASFDIFTGLASEKEFFHSMLSLVTAVANVQHLSFTISCVEALDHDELKNQLPVFHNLKHLELGRGCWHKWDIVLLEFLKCSPRLETLGFPRGIVANVSWSDEAPKEYLDMAETERQEFSTNRQDLCCKSFLKRIVIKEYCGVEREMEVVRFLLKNAWVLEELLVVCEDEVDRASLESNLKKLPRASSTCLIIVQ